MKIGNRIAIMEGGRIIQIGTPQQIVLAPENDYVAEFVAHMNPLNVLKATDIMLPITDNTSENRQIVDATTPLRELIPMCIAADKPILVSNATGIIGELDSNSLLKSLQ
jgi:glycine betaine/proline transport system ATP-binding protein